MPVNRYLIRMFVFGGLSLIAGAAFVASANGRASGLGAGIPLMLAGGVFVLLSLGWFFMARRRSAEPKLVSSKHVGDSPIPERFELRVIRDAQNASDFLRRYDVLVDDTFVASLGVGEAAVIPLAEGAHTVRASLASVPEAGSFPLDVAGDRGDRIDVRVTPSLGSSALRKQTFWLQLESSAHP